MGKLFGTDGIRGHAVSSTISDHTSIDKLVDERQLSLGLMQLIGEALGNRLRPSSDRIAEVVVGWDERPLNARLVSSLTVGLHLSGCKVTWTGECATPGLHACILDSEADAGCMITASHNPVSDSGVKIFNNEARKTLPEEEKELEVLIHQFAAEERELSDSEIRELGRPDSQVNGLNIHRSVLNNRLPLLKSRYLGDGDPSALIPEEGLLLDSSKGSASVWLADWMTENLFPTLELSFTCQALNDGCGAGDISPTLRMTWQELTCKHHNHVIFDGLSSRYREGVWKPGMILAAALDGDGDRCLCIRVDDYGGGIEVIDGDRMLDVLTMAASHNQSGLKGKVAASIESDLALLSSLDRLDADLIALESAVGDRWLAVALGPEKDSQSGLLRGIDEPFHLGGEDSGHLLMTTPHPNKPEHWALVGDGIATLIATLFASACQHRITPFSKGWKLRKSISPSDRSRWDGKNQHAKAVESMLWEWLPHGAWQRMIIPGEENLLLMKAKIGAGELTVAVRNSGTQAKTSVSIRATEEALSVIETPLGLMESLIAELSQRLRP